MNLGDTVNHDQANEIAEAYLKRWNLSNSPDERLDNFREQFFSWLSQIPQKAHPAIIKLLDSFNYYTHEKTNGLLVSLHAILVERYHLADDDTIYTFVKSKRQKSNSSNDYWTEYKYLNGLNKEICIVDPDSLESIYWDEIHNIVFIDDCCGTGKTFCDYIEVRQDRYREKKVFFIALHMMLDAIEQIAEISEQLDISIEVINSVIQDKAFSPAVFEDEEKSAIAKKLIIQVSTDLAIPQKEILGFGNAESLMAFYNNTPNNTIGIIRYDTNNFFSIFPREKTVIPGWRANANRKKQRQIKNYNAAL
jgi:hypothetical protein